MMDLDANRACLPRKKKTRIAKLNVLNDTNIYTGYDSLPLQRQLYYKVTLSQENV